MCSKIEGKAEVIVCSWNDKGPVYSRKLIFYSKDQLFHCFKELKLKKLREKKDLIGDFRYLEVLEGFPNCLTKNLSEESSRIAFFTALDPTEYWGMIYKGVGVPVFTNRKIKTTKKRNAPEWS